MANWKKVIVSGSAAELLQVTASTAAITTLNVTAGSGSFSGSFFGNGAGLTGVPATGIVLSPLTDGNGIVDFTYNGQSTATVSVEVSGSTLEVGTGGVRVADGGIASAQLADNAVITAKILNGNVTNAKLANSSIYMAGGAGLTGDGSTALGASGSLAVGAGLGITVNANDVAVDTGSAHFTAGVRGKISVVDNAGDGSLTYNSSTGVLTYAGVTSGSVRGYFTASDTTGPSGIDMAYNPSTGTFSGSLVNSKIVVTDGSTPSNIDLGGTLTFSGTNNEVTVAQAGGTVTVGLPDSVTITTDLTVSRDLTVTRNLVVLGTASFQNTEDLDVADRFIRMASGSTSAGDGGIVVQQTSATNGEAFAFDSATTRWGLTGSFDASTNTIAPDAFMAAVVVGSGTNPDNAPARYDAKGNIFVGTDGEIYIYS